MKKYFIPYELAKQLIELGFSEKTFDVYNDGRFKMDSRHNIPHTKKIIWEQAFEFFREKYNLHPSFTRYKFSSINREPNIFTHLYEIQIIDENTDKIFLVGDFNTYGEAELDCLKKLIEIVKIKQHE